MKNDWKKTLEAFEPEWYGDLEIMEAFISSLLEEQKKQIIGRRKSKIKGSRFRQLLDSY